MVFFSPSRCMGFDYIARAPLLPSSGGLFFGCRLTFLVGLILFVNGCWTASCDFGVFTTGGVLLWNDAESELGKEYIKAVYCHPVYLTQSFYSTFLSLPFYHNLEILERVTKFQAGSQGKTQDGQKAEDKHPKWFLTRSHSNSWVKFFFFSTNVVGTTGHP